MSKYLKLEDFLPAYDGINIDKNDPVFAFYKDKIPSGYNLEFPITTFLKKEFNELSLPLSEPEFKKGEPFKPLNQQAFMARFLSPLTPYDKMIVFHDVGTGKACLSAMISELSSKFYETDDKREETLILNKNDKLSDNLKEEIAYKCTNGKYIPSDIDPKTKEVITSEQKLRRRNVLLGKNYLFDTFEAFASKLSERSDDEISFVFSNRIIIIDEAHNISAQYKKSKEVQDDKNKKIIVDIYKQFHRFLHLVENCKIVLMTATPMRDKKKEIASLLNLILPLDKQINVDTFDTDYFEGDSFKENRKVEFKNIMRGMVSYVRVTSGNVKKVPETNPDGPNDWQGDKIKIPLYEVYMNEIQNKGYINAFKADGIKLNVLDEQIENIEEEDEDKKSTKSLYSNSRQASMFVTPDGKFGQEGLREWVNISEHEKSLSKDEKKEERKDVKRGKSSVLKPVDYYLTKTNDDFKKWIGYDDGNGDKEEMLKKLDSISIKFGCSIREILKFPNEKAFVYSNLVSESGTTLFAAILELFGFEHVRIPKDRNDINLESYKNKSGKKQYLLITGTFPSTNQMRILTREIFNHPKNKYGDYIHCIISSKVIAEGVSFFHCRQFHNLTPGWNETETLQAEGRVIRVVSHVDFEDERERYIKLFRWCALPINKSYPSIDFRMYKISAEKDFVNKQIERLMKESAVDCALNVKRNMRPGYDYNGSRDCDYDNCIYYCDNIPASWYLEEKYWPANEKRVPQPSLITDSYNLYYANEEIANIKKQISELFQLKFAYFYEDILQVLRNTAEIVLIRALKEMIEQSYQIKNKYGLTCYLRESKNLYYLINTYEINNNKDLYLLSWYSENPIIKENLSFETWIEIFQHEYLNEKLNILKDIENNNLFKDKKGDIFTDPKQIKSLEDSLKELPDSVQQALLESFHKAHKEKLKTNEKLRDVILNIYKGNISDIPNLQMSFSKFNSITEDVLRCYDYKTKKWKDCNKDETIKLLTYKEEKKGEDITPEMQFFGYYGSIKTGNLLIGRVELKLGVTDKRKSGTAGNVCGTGRYSAGKTALLLLWLDDKIDEAKRENLPFSDNLVYPDILKHINKSVQIPNKKEELVDKIANKLVEFFNKSIFEKPDQILREEYNYYNLIKTFKNLETNKAILQTYSIEKLQRWFLLSNFNSKEIVCPTLKQFFVDNNCMISN
jgi:hypothetical protein